MKKHNNVYKSVLIFPTLYPDYTHQNHNFYNTFLKSELMSNPRNQLVINLCIAIGAIDTIAVGLRVLANKRSGQVGWSRFGSGISGACDCLNFPRGI